MCECLNVFPKVVFSFVDALETIFDLLEALPQFDNILPHYGWFPLTLHDIQDQRA